MSCRVPTDVIGINQRVIIRLVARRLFRLLSLASRTAVASEKGFLKIVPFRSELSWSIDFQSVEDIILPIADMSSVHEPFHLILPVEIVNHVRAKPLRFRAIR